MKIQNVTDASFRKYGKIITEYSFEKILKRWNTHHFRKTLSMYRLLKSWKYFEAAEICKKGFGGLPIQLDTVMETTIN